MKDKLLKKTLVIGITVLFVGLIIVPSINSQINLKQKNTSTGLASFNPFKEGWEYRKKITINHNMVDGNLASFPVLVSTTDSDLRDKAQIDGDDILFMDDKGKANPLFHEIEYFDGSSGELVAWVNIPILSSFVDTVFYMYYGNLNCTSQEFPESVWDSYCCSVWHLDDFHDSTINGNDGGNHGTADCSGKIGNARSFVRSERDYIDWGDMSEPSNNNINKATFEAWIKPGTSFYGCWPFQKANSGDYEPDRLSYVFDIGSNGKIGFIACSGTWYPDRKQIRFLTDDSHVITGSWQHVAVVVDLFALNMDIFYNGEEKESTRTIQGTPPAYFYDVLLSDESGRSIDEINDKYYDGDMDELRISKICRSSDWIKTSFNTVNNFSSFLTIYPEEPKNRAYINTPFLRFLQQHLNLFPILQKILLFMRLGLH